MNVITDGVKLQYPLSEKIGISRLFVGRESEFKKFHKWINNMPKRLSKSWAILGRRKSGKTVFIQRLFNQIWSANGKVIPFYFSISEGPVWYPELALEYYTTFASHYISFLERDPMLVRKPLTLEEIRAYGQANSLSVLVQDVDRISDAWNQGLHGSMWRIARRAPHELASVYDQRILVIIDEFQYLSTNIYAHEDFSGEPIRALPGSYHGISESKVAPMLATGSYVGWMVDLMSKHLEAGRLSHIDFSPYLTDSEGLMAVYQYAAVYDEPITNETAVQINELCKADPFFISCVIHSDYPGRDLTTTEGVIEAVNYEITERGSELSKTWREYIDRAVERINDRYGKHLLLHLNKHNQRYWTPKELKEVLHLEEDEGTIYRRLLALHKADLLRWGTSDIQFAGLQDGTLNLILRNRFEEEIAQHQPDLRVDFRVQTEKLLAENRSLRGKLSHVRGQVIEYQFANAIRSRKRFHLSHFFEGVTDDSQLNIVDVRTRIFIQRDDDKPMELDIVAESDDGRVILVEVRNRQAKSAPDDIQNFQEKVVVYQEQHPKAAILGTFLSLGGFTKKALEMCETQGIAWSTELQYF